jgi:hypothetical protein
MPVILPQRGVIVPKIAPITGRYYGYRHAYGQSTTTLALTADLLYGVPFFVHSPLTADQIALNITTAAAGGKLIRLGLYGATAAGQPGALIVASGALAADPGAVPDPVAATIAAALVPGRLYYLALVTDGTPTVTAVAGTMNQFGQTTAADANSRSCVQRTFTYAALPDPWGTPSANPASVPNIVVRAA